MPAVEAFRGPAARNERLRLSERATAEGAPEPGGDAESAGFHCDFCGDFASSVKRVALDGAYERLRTPHKPRFACAACSERKERERLEAASG